MNVQMIDLNGEKAAVIPLADYEALLAKAELAEDLADADRIQKAIADGEETWPAEVVNRLIDGDNPVLVFREHRGMKQRELAAKIGMTPSGLSQIEKNGTNSVDTLKKLAVALGVDLDDLVQ